ALFILDWTYGRVWALPLEASGSSWKAVPIEFMTAIGQHGFAPTDAEAGPDGSLYLAVGGRGTRGGVYRIRARTPHPDLAALPALQSPQSTVQERLNLCLNVPMPLSSWARATWEPVAAQLGKEPFQAAAADSSRSQSVRIRAI